MPATRCRPGSTSFSNSSHLPPISGSNVLKPGHVAPRARQILNEAGTDWIGHRNEYDRDACVSLDRNAVSTLCAICEDHVRRLGSTSSACVGAGAIELAGGPANHRSDMFRPSVQPSSWRLCRKRRGRSPSIWISFGVAHQHADPPHPVRAAAHAHLTATSQRRRREALMNSRRRMSAPKLRRQHCIGSNEYFDRG